MKRLLAVFLCALLISVFCGAACASGLTIEDGSALLEELDQFPFTAETGEAAVNVRKEMDAKSEKVGRLVRGEKLTTVYADLNAKGEMWYAVELADGTKGFIRSDLLVKSEEMAVMRAANQPTDEEAAMEYIGNRKSKKFHVTTCRTLPKENNRTYFSSREEAVNEGYAPCGNCKP